MGNCKECGKEVKRYNKFCSRSCAAKHNNRGVTRWKKPRRPCNHCGTPVTERHNKYCDRCIEQRVFRPPLSLSEAKTDRARRLALIRERGHICSVCKNTEWNSKPIPLEIDHINGDATNNSPENVRLICPNCHAQTDTYKGKNMGKSKRKFYIVPRVA